VRATQSGGHRQTGAAFDRNH